MLDLISCVYKDNILNIAGWAIFHLWEEGTRYYLRISRTKLVNYLHFYERKTKPTSIN
jgi:hypothetical protein